MFMHIQQEGIKMVKCSGCGEDKKLYYEWRDIRLPVDGKFCSKNCVIVWAFKTYMVELQQVLQK